MQYTLNIHKSDYSSYSLTSDNETIGFSDPMLIHGMFHGDTVKYEKDNIILVNRKPLKTISGELELYSKYSFKPNKRGVPTYIFKPINRFFPKFLVCSNLKKQYTSNVYVTVEYQDWPKNSVFPKANLLQNFGQIYDLQALQYALLYNYNLENKQQKLDFKGITRKFNNIEKQERFLIQNKILSIDPEGCTDIDDGFSIDDDGNNRLSLQIHISDVYYLLKNLNIIDNVENITSIYLEDSVKHMLPTIISSNLGSLLRKNNRFMLTLDILYDIEKDKIENIDFKKSFGYIDENYNYDNYPRYIKKYFMHVSRIYNIITGNRLDINSSHLFIEALMIIYNTHFATSVFTDCIGVYRSQPKKTYENKDVDEKLSKFLKLITSNSALYTHEKLIHSSLGILEYTHATSPLRRIVDLVNQEIFYTKKSSILDRISIEEINNLGKHVKRFYRDLNKLVLAYRVYNEGSYRTECYVYDYSIEKRKTSVYFPNENISIKMYLINYKLCEIYDTVCIDDKIEVRSNGELVQTIPLNRKIMVKINGKPDIYNIDSSIVIEILD